MRIVAKSFVDYDALVRKASADSHRKTDQTLQDDGRTTDQYRCSIYSTPLRLIRRKKTRFLFAGRSGVALVGVSQGTSVSAVPVHRI